MVVVEDIYNMIRIDSEDADEGVWEEWRDVKGKRNHCIDSQSKSGVKLPHILRIGLAGH